MAERHAVHFRHHDVAEHQVETRRARLKRLQRLLRVVHENRFVAKLAEKLRRKLAHFGVVLDNEDAAPGGGKRRCGAVRVVGDVDRLGRGGKSDREGGALADFALDAHRAARLAGKAVDLRQAEAGAPSDLLRREERLEDLVDPIGCDAAAGIADRDGHGISRPAGVARIRPRRGRCARADGRHRRSRRAHWPRRLTRAVSNWLGSASIASGRSAASISSTIRRSDHGPEHLRDALDLGHRVEDARIERLAAREGEQLAGELGGAVGRVRNGVDVAAAPVFGEIAPSRRSRRRADDRQEIVEVMGDAAGELADALHLLRVPQGLLGSRAR